MHPHLLPTPFPKNKSSDRTDIGNLSHCLKMVIHYADSLPDVPSFNLFLQNPADHCHYLMQTSTPEVLMVVSSF